MKLFFSIVAGLATIGLIIGHFHYQGWQTLVYVLVATGAGYWFGQWTCHLHKRQRGFWLTSIVFAVLNFLHSMIDGVSIGEFSSVSSGIAILSHELARQPVLYIVLWGMLTPFVGKKLSRIIIVPGIVSGVWLLGVYTGNQLFQSAGHIATLEPFVEYGVFIFLGDIIHHIIEEYRKYRNTDSCCHTVL